MKEVPLMAPGKSRLVFSSVLNILWNFLTLQILLAIFLLNLGVFFPAVLPSGPVFVLDSAEYIEDLYYHGPGPQEIDDQDLNQQWFQEDTYSG